MSLLKSKDYKIYSTFLGNLARKLTQYYYSKLNKTFKVSNKIKGKGYDPVTSSDKAFEKFIRNEIKKKFPNHEVIGEEYGSENLKSEYIWVIDPLDGTHSFISGKPLFGTLISCLKNNKPIVPGNDEININPASRSAKLRYAIKTDENDNFNELHEKFNYLIETENLSYNS